MTNYKILSDSPIFNGLSEKELSALLKKIHYQKRVYKKNEIVASSDETVSSLLIILSGMVKAEMMDLTGKTIKIEDIEAPKPLAAAFLFGKENKYPVTVTAINAVEILAIPVDEFLVLLQQNKQVLKNYLNSITSRSQFLSKKLQFLSFRTIKSKMAHYILQNANTELHFELNSTQQQLSELFGVTRPSLARVIREMQDEKLIEIRRRKVNLLNKKELINLIQNG